MIYDIKISQIFRGRNIMKTIRLITTIILVSWATMGVSADKLTLIYLTADNWPTCKVWDRWSYPKFKSSDLIKKINYTVVKVDFFDDLSQKDAWSKDLYWIRDKAAGQYPPRWYVIKNKELLLESEGLNGWDNEILPYLKKSTTSK